MTPWKTNSLRHIVLDQVADKRNEGALQIFQTVLHPRDA